MRKLAIGALSALALALPLAACSESANQDSAPAQSDPAAAPSAEAPVIAWISPDATSSARWEEKDWPIFEAEVKRLAPDAKLLPSTAATEDDMLRQAEAAATQGADVIVINPITSDGSLPIAELAEREGIPVLAYEGLIEDADLAGYITFDNRKVGQIQAQYMVDNAGENPTFAIMNGAQVCTACIDFKLGAHDVFDPLVESGDIRVEYEADTPEWSSENAQMQTEQALTALQDQVDGIYSANDGLAQGIIAALKARNLNGEVIVTGQDATTAGLQEILLGNQTMTVYKALRDQAEAGARAAVALATGDPDTGLVDEFQNGPYLIPALFLEPVALDRSNISLVLDDGFITEEELCSGEAANHCDF